MKLNRSSGFLQGGNLVNLLLCVALIAACCAQTESRPPLQAGELERWLSEEMALLGNDHGTSKRAGSEASSLWFGPRLGRRRRSVPLSNDDEDVEELQAETLADLFRVAPWALISLKDYSNKRQTVPFTPRLGRNMDSGDSGETLKGYPPFTPRLGRGGVPPFTPRLGRREEPQMNRLQQSNEH